MPLTMFRLCYIVGLAAARLPDRREILLFLMHVGPPPLNVLNIRRFKHCRAHQTNIFPYFIPLNRRSTWVFQVFERPATDCTAAAHQIAEGVNCGPPCTPRRPPMFLPRYYTMYDFLMYWSGVPEGIVL